MHFNGFGKPIFLIGGGVVLACCGEGLYRSRLTFTEENDTNHQTLMYLSEQKQFTACIDARVLMGNYSYYSRRRHIHYFVIAAR